MNAQVGDRIAAQLADWLAEYDEASASGGDAPSPQELERDQQVRGVLLRARACIRRMQQAWPAGASDPTLPKEPTGPPVTGMEATTPERVAGSRAPQDKRPSLPAFEVPGFQIVRLLGGGGMGLVYLARQLSLDRFVALKVLPPALSADLQSLQRFRNEAALAARLLDSHILPVIDILDVHGVPILVMPFIDGPD